MSQPPSSGDWPDPYASSSASANQPPQGQPTQPAYNIPPQQPYNTPGPPPPGYPSYSPYQPVAASPPTNSLAIASLICSLAGLVVGISAPVGAILGHIARKQIRERGEQGEGMAMAGIIVGWVLTGIFVLCCIGYIGVIVFAVSQDPTI